MTVADVTLRGFGFRPAGSQRWAVRNVDLTVGAGERVLLLGASGSGKSTVLRSIAGLLDASGEVAGDVAVAGAAPRAGMPQVGLLLQDPNAGLVLSRAGEDVAFGPQNLGLQPDEVARRVTDALTAVGFPYPPERAITALSEGERQRLALAGVIALGPEVLLLDEPTSMLDPAGAALVREAVERVVSDTGATVIVVEHDVEPWLSMVDRVVILGSEGVLADGDVESVRASPASRMTWLGEARLPRERVLASGTDLIAATRVTYRPPRGDADVLHEVSCRVAEGSLLAVTGANGSGKTTLVRLLGGLTKPRGGSVDATHALTDGLSDGRSDGRARSAPHSWSARMLAGRIGSVFQNPEHSFVTNDVRSELAAGPHAVGQPPRAVASRVDELLTRLRLDHVADQNPFTLSGGEQRRLSVGAALATAPRVLALDEPTFGQDPMTWRELADLVLELRESGHGIVAATHDDRFCDVVSDCTLHLDHGRAVAR